MRAEILRPDPPLGFVHPLVRDAVYHELPPAERELEHERAAQAAAGRRRRRRAGGRAAAASPRAAARLGRRAARARRRGGACARARRRARSRTCAARSRSRRRPSAGRVLLALGIAEALTSGPAAAEHLQEAYDALDDPGARGELALLLFGSLLFTDAVAEACAVARERRARRSARSTATCGAGSRRWRSSTYYFGGDQRLLARMAAQRRPPAEPGPGAKALAGVAAYDWANRDGTAEETAALALTALAGGELLATGNAWSSIIAHDDAGAGRSRRGARAARGCSRPMPTGAARCSTSAPCTCGSATRSGGTASSRRPSRAASAPRSREFDTYGLGDSARAYADAILCQVLRRARRRAGGAPGARAQRGRRRRRPTRARHWLHAELALLVAEGRWDERLARRGAVPTSASRRTATRPATPLAARWAPRRSTGSGAPTRRSRSRATSWSSRAATARPAMLGRALRVLGRLERDAGLARLEEAVAVLAG